MTVPSQPRIFTPSTFKALTGARGETLSMRGWKWVVVLVVAGAVLALVLVGPSLLP